MLESSPIIVEFQHIIYEEFMRRIANSSLEAHKRYKRYYIILIIYIHNLDSEIVKNTLQSSHILSCYILLSWVWASKCLL